MGKNKRTSLQYYILFFCLLVLFLINLYSGSVKIPLKSIFSIISGDETVKESWRYIVLNYRLPKAIVAILTGVALSLSGLLMQTLFRNPMAGPYVLGLSSGAGLGVAFVILGTSFLPAFIVQIVQSSYGITLASVGGSLLLLFLILALAKRVKQSVTLLIIGLMFGNFAAAIVTMLTYFSSAEQLKRFTFWAMGSLGNQTWEAIALYGFTVLVGGILSLISIRSLDALLLGERYASSMGVDIKKARRIIITATGILAGGATAFVGPIAFIGLAVPHIARLLLQTSSHARLLLGTVFIGAIFMLFCDALTQLPGQSFVLPINAITSVLGAPLVIYLLLKNK